ncbi:hypothetical protein BH09PSE6_BH09PSE6_21870 [soil metagenome]
MFRTLACRLSACALLLASSMLASCAAFDDDERAPLNDGRFLAPRGAACQDAQLTSPMPPVPSPAPETRMLREPADFIEKVRTPMNKNRQGYLFVVCTVQVDATGSWDDRKRAVSAFERMTAATDAAVVVDGHRLGATAMTMATASEMTKTSSGMRITQRYLALIPTDVLATSDGQRLACALQGHDWEAVMDAFGGWATFDSRGSTDPRGDLRAFARNLLADIPPDRRPAAWDAVPPETLRLLSIFDDPRRLPDHPMIKSAEFPECLGHYPAAVRFSNGQSLTRYGAKDTLDLMLKELVPPYLEAIRRDPDRRYGVWFDTLHAELNLRVQQEYRLLEGLDQWVGLYALARPYGLTRATERIRFLRDNHTALLAVTKTLSGPQARSAPLSKEGAARREKVLDTFKADSQQLVLGRERAFQSFLQSLDRYFRFVQASAAAGTLPADDAQFSRFAKRDEANRLIKEVSGKVDAATPDWR